MSFYNDPTSPFFNLAQAYGSYTLKPVPPSGGGVAPPALTPADRLARLQAWYGSGDVFHWTQPPTPLKRGVFPTHAHVTTWYNSVIDLGYSIEDIGFGLDELLWLWAPYARETWPVVYANYNRAYGNDAYPLE